MDRHNSKSRLCAYAGIRELTAKGGIKEAFNSARVCSYGSVELLYIKDECKNLIDSADRIKAAIDESGLPVSCISCFVDLVSESAPYGAMPDAQEAVKECIDLAKAIGCDRVHHTLVTRLNGNRLDYAPIFQKVLPIAEELADYAKSRGIEILYEPQGMIFNGLVGYSTFFDLMRARHKNVGLCLDVGNPLWVGEDCYSLAEKYADYIRHVHLKDYVLGTAKKEEESGTVDRGQLLETPYRTLLTRRIKEVRLATGIIDLKRVFDILTSANYSGALSIEDNTCPDFADTARNAHAVVNALIKS